GRPSKKTGRLVAVCISAISTGDGERVVISHTPLTFCIHTPRLATIQAIQSTRKTGTSSGLHNNECTARLSSIAHLLSLMAHIRGMDQLSIFQEGDNILLLFFPALFSFSIF